MPAGIFVAIYIMMAGAEQDTNANQFPLMESLTDGDVNPETEL
jgi:hypothetical protein